MSTKASTVVKRVVDVLTSCLFRIQFFFKIRTKGLNDRENNSTALLVDGHTGNKVKYPVREWVIVVVQSVQLHHPNEQCVAQIAIWKERNRNAGLVVHVQHIHVEIFTVQLKGVQCIDVLHHQIPSWHTYIKHRALQKFEDQSLWRSNTVVRKFPNLVRAASSGILESYRKHLILVQRLIQGDVTELWMEFVLILLQLSSIGQLYILSSLQNSRST